MNQATKDFIREHTEADVRQLALRGTKDTEVDLTFALEQIAGRQMARTKIPSWAIVEDIIYPPHLSMEQCSSEQTARYKASIAGEGALVVDLTAGFGVDMAFISQGFERAVHVERQPSLCAISSENYKRLGLKHIEVVCGDGIDYLHQLDHADLVFIDPARRDEHGSRTYGIADCTPNVLEILDEMVEKADRVMLKLSPMLDWRKAVEELKKVSEVHIVSVDNECKELLVILEADEKPLRVFCVNNDSVFVFEGDYKSPTHLSGIANPLQQEPTQILHSSLFTLHFLYEPNASIMKAGCFELMEQCFGVRQLDSNSHLFVSNTEIPEFPGRKFIIERITTMNKHDLKIAFAGIDRANITIRNFPMSVAELRKKLRLKDGGDLYVFATTVAGQGHQLFICRKKS
ncbi:MAG: RsmD family RNA methyltransferase [Prevotella sp.]|nr:RsmD family RNA methyltransferase [Prevotella sp.]